MRASGLVPTTVAVGAALVLAGCGGSGDDGTRAATPPAGTTTTAAPPAPSLPSGRAGIRALRPDRVARRVAALRGLRLDELPPVRVVDPKRARRDQDEDTGETRRALAENDAVLSILGLLKPGQTSRSIATTVTEEGVLGYFDPKKGGISIVNSGKRLPRNAETTIAHEMTHAVDDQALGIGRRLLAIGDDTERSSAFQAVVEGSATRTEAAYAAKYRTPDDDPSQDAAGAKLLKAVPFGLLFELSAPYELGRRFVEALAAQGGNAAVDRALRRPPRTTVEILVPQLYQRGFRAQRVRVDGRRALGRGWRAVRSQTLGALDTVTLTTGTQEGLRQALPPAQSWRGGRFQLLSRGAIGAKGCAAPCPSRRALVANVRWDTPFAASSFLANLERDLTRRRGARAAGPGAWTVEGGAVAVRRAGRSTTFAYAPTTAQARALAARPN